MQSGQSGQPGVKAVRTCLAHRGYLASDLIRGGDLALSLRGILVQVDRYSTSSIEKVGLVEIKVLINSLRSTTTEPRL